MHRLRLKASRNIGFCVTVSARALKVARRSSFSGFDHQFGMMPHRIGTSCRVPARSTTVCASRW